MINKIISYVWHTLKAIVILSYVSIDMGKIKRMASIILSRLKHQAVRAKSKEPIKTEVERSTSKPSRAKPAQTPQTPSIYKRYFDVYMYLIDYLRDCMRFKCVTVKLMWYANTASSLFTLVGIAWVCEKLDINLKFILEGSYLTDYFENPDFNSSRPCDSQGFSRLREPITHLKYLEDNGVYFRDTLGVFAENKISSEYGYKIISKLSMKQDLKQEADEWYRAHIKGNCIAVHFRGTDNAIRIKIEDYLAYLKEVMDKDSYIFACSDEAQFISQIKEAFPGRVFARDIERSYTDEPIHFGNDPQQIRDAFIDLLVLAKTELIYTTGSRFAGVVRFFNPKIKIISTMPESPDGYKNIHNPKFTLPTPKPHLVKKIRKEVINTNLRSPQ